MDTHNLKFEGKGAHKRRNMSRVIVEVEALSKGGASILYHRVDDGVSRVELYADDLPGVLPLVRTEAHLLAKEAAELHGEALRREWIEEHKEDLQRLGSQKERDDYVQRNCNLAPEQLYATVGKAVRVGNQIVSLDLRKGLPPLGYAKLVDKAGDAGPDVADFAALTDEERERFLIEPPAMVENAQDRAASTQAKLLASVLVEMQKQSDTKQSRKSA